MSPTPTAQPYDATRTMRAMAIVEGALQPIQLPRPVAKPGEIIIKTAYIGVNRADLLQIAGQYAPPEGASPLPGLEIAGIVAQNDADNLLFTPGMPVCALLSGGGYAEYVAVPAAHVLPLPAGITLQQAASLPEAAATAYMALALEANLQPGERVLVHGGASGLGILMTQIARAWGAEVFATVGTAEKAAQLARLGIHAINHRTAPFAAQLMAATGDAGVDVIIDTLGGPQVETHLRLLRHGGRLVTLAALEGTAVAPFKMTRLLMNHLRWSGATLRSRTGLEKAAIMAGVQARIWPHLATGAILPVVDSVFPLAQAQKALERMQERLHMGKILLEVAPET
ncbi:MAG: NAD(P)H-quinone oxidoreductase [Pseudomonadota bacterium]